MMEFTTKEPIERGWSGDKKYKVTDGQGQAYLYRVAPPEKYDRHRAVFQRAAQVAALGVPMSVPKAFGRCDEGVYTLWTWIDGRDAEDAIRDMSEGQSYALGLEAGRILKRIHSIPAPETQEPWESRFNRKIDAKLRGYTECPLKYEGGEAFLDYIAENRHLLHGRPQTYQHGDYHIGNMMLDREGQLRIIDFDRDDFGDPWEEFNRIVWCAQASPVFATGMVNGYFEGPVPAAFWRLLALYIASNTLSSLYWAIPYGEGEVMTMRRQAGEVLTWYKGMREPIPTWYRRDL